MNVKSSTMKVELFDSGGYAPAKWEPAEMICRVAFCQYSPHYGERKAPLA